MSLPNFSSLSMDPKPRSSLTPNAGDGRYCLDFPDDTTFCDSSIVILRKALNITDEQTDELKEFMLDESKVPKTPNPMNPNTFVKRRQTTFGALYNFGQKVASQGGDMEQWPEAVRQSLEYARVFAESRGIAKELYNGVHVNYYPDGSAGVAPHFDSESDMLRGLPIVSVTLLTGDKKPRPFSIYEKPSTKGARPHKLADVQLGHDDVLIMMGRMQETFLHGVEPAKPPKDFKKAGRLNLTVRAFNSDAVARAGVKREREESF
jgi:alkylated DNA repair dioxygenase AlkB